MNNKNMKLFIVLAVLINLSTCFKYRLRDLSHRNKNKCERVKPGICKENVHSKYNSTSFPNRFNHETQNDASRHMGNEFRSLINVGCSEYLVTFLCSLYVPVCSPDLIAHIQPCRSLCENSKAGCSRLMKLFGVKWAFDCNEFPMDGSTVCIGSDYMKKQVMKTTNKRRGSVKVKRDSASNITCEVHKHIFIKKIRHTKDSSCCPVASKAVLSAMCNGKHECLITNTAKNLGGHCTGSVGDLTIMYRCAKNNKDGFCKEVKKKGLF